MKKRKWLVVFCVAVLICAFTAAAWASEPIKLVVNGQEIKPDVSPQIVGNRTMVPVRWIAEVLGAEVKWDAQSKTVFITTKTNDSKNQNDTDIQAVTKLVEKFGDKIKNVSLLAPKNIVIKSIEENYGEIVSPALLAQWQSDPQNAPGRASSSPWPERIDITDIEKLSDSKYQVEGEIINMTSVEMLNGGYASKRSVILAVEKPGNRWLITVVKYNADPKTNIYHNSQYGFSFELPESWQGYTIVSDQWKGFTVGSQEAEPAQTGLLFSIRHPRWTTDNPRQDIPIMVFTLSQWESLQRHEFSVGAAPIGPRELGRNNQYVFALPARYNFAFPTGYEEVERILESNPLTPLEKGIIPSELAEKIIKDTADQLVYALSTKDGQAISGFAHPIKGVRFTPYTHVSLGSDVVFNKEKIRNLFNDQKVYLWGYYDGSGEEIKLTPRQYYEKFVYAENYMNAKKIGYNKVLSIGNMLENQFEVYDNAIVVEYYFPGFNPDYAGLDWRSLRLVFQPYENDWKLVGIINNQWTI